MSRLRRRLPRGDRGDTLVELLATVLIMGIAVTVILGAVASTLRFTDMHRKQAVAGAAVREFAERIETSAALAYPGCVPLSTYDAMYTATPSGFERKTLDVTYWDGTKFVGTCTADAVRRISVQVRSTDGRAEERLDVVIRKPCRTSDPLC
jgi:Tfp pilus assembly protein PilV